MAHMTTLVSPDLDPRTVDFVSRPKQMYVDGQWVDALSGRHGDMVEIMETRPLSKNKNWRLVRIVAKAKAGEAEPVPAAPEVGQPAS